MQSKNKNIFNKPSPSKYISKISENFLLMKFRLLEKIREVKSFFSKAFTYWVKH